MMASIQNTNTNKNAKRNKTSNDNWPAKRPLEAKFLIAVLALFIISCIIGDEPVDLTVNDHNNNNGNNAKGALRQLDNTPEDELGDGSTEGDDVEIMAERVEGAVWSSGKEGDRHIIHIGKPSELILGDAPQETEIKVINNETKPIMHTFFEPTERACCGMSKGEHESLLSLWEQSWEDKGWKTVILTKADAETHPSFERLEEKLIKLEINEYNRRCYWRWLAMVQVGGGWMSDYDNFPLELDAQMGIELERDDPNSAFHSYLGFIPALIHASGPEWDRVIGLMIEMLPDEPNGERINDMRSLALLGESGEGGKLWDDHWDRKVAQKFSYKRDEEEDTLSIDCASYVGRLAVHLSHSASRIAIEDEVYPIEVGEKEDVAAHRAKAATVMLDDYHQYCDNFSVEKE